MKTVKYIFLLFIVFLNNSNSAFAQVDNHPWCPSGATWLYSRTTQFSQEYLKLSYSRDTVINNMPTKILRTAQIDIVGPGPFPQYGRTETYLREEYYANVNDSIYWWNGGQFRFLCDFTANVGDKWTIHENKDYTCDTGTIIAATDTFSVTATGTQVFDGITFNTIQGNNQGQWQTGMTIIKNIGSLVSPYPIPIDPTPGVGFYPCHHFDWYGNPQSLTCYYDDLRGHISFSWYADSVCNYFATPIEKIPSSNKENLAALIKIYPNPTINEITIDAPNAVFKSYAIYDLNGRLLEQGDYENTLFFEKQVSGVYFLVLTTMQNVQHPFKIIKI